VADAFQGAGIPIGAAAMDVRIVRSGVDADPKRVAAIVGAQPSANGAA